MGQPVITCPSCGRPNGIEATACAFCGGQLARYSGLAEPFTGYPPPFSDAAPAPPSPAVQSPPVAIPIPAPEAIAPRAARSAAEPVEPQTEVTQEPQLPPVLAEPSFIPLGARQPRGGATEYSTASSLFGGLNLPEDVFAMIYSLTKQNLRIQAVVILRDNTGLGLREAKDIIDRLATLIGTPPAAVTRCYIATACYGDAEHPDVLTLRRFRDETLLQTVWGRAFVRSYYAVSPAIARNLGRDAALAGLIRRAVLVPLVRRLRARRADQ